MEEGERSEDLDKKTCGVWSRDSFYPLGLVWPWRTVWTPGLSPRSKENSLGSRSSLPVAMPSTFTYWGRPPVLGFSELLWNLPMEGRRLIGGVK